MADQYLANEVSLGRVAGRFSAPLTCDQASLYFRGGKVRLIQIRDYLSVASPESGLLDRKSTRLNSSHLTTSRMPSSA